MIIWVKLEGQGYRWKFTATRGKRKKVAKVVGATSSKSYLSLLGTHRFIQN